MRMADGLLSIVLLEQIEAVFTVYLEGVFEAGVFV
jgi:hypothetical protein